MYSAFFGGVILNNDSFVCSLCPRNCGALRDERGGDGFCGLGSQPRISRAAPHMWEEPCISGSRGSGTIFFSGCTLSCVYCQNYCISAGRQGITVSEYQLAGCYKKLEEMGVHNINLVTPTPYIDSIIRSFDIYRPSVPIVYNTGGYEKPETLRRLEGIVDIYLPDVKYSDDSAAVRYSSAPDYFGTAMKAVEEMVRQTGSPVFDDDGMMKKGTIVRNLILPGMTGNSIRILRALDESFGDKILVSLMCQYIPEGRASEYPEINRRITKREYEKVLSVLEETSLEGFVQEMSSAKKEYIPDFSPDALRQFLSSI